MSAELSSLGIAQIVESVIADYDLRDEDGNELTDDLYVIRSERLDELGLTVARRIHKAIRELEAQGKTGFPVHSMLCGIRRQPSRRRMTGPTRCASTTPAKRLQSKASTRPHWPTSRKPSTTFSRR